MAGLAFGRACADAVLAGGRTTEGSSVGRLLPDPSNDEVHFLGLT